MADNDAPLRVSVTALGCRLNYAEMAELAGVLAAAGCEVVSESDDADVRVLNTCSVTAQADATTRQRLRAMRRESPAAHIIATGCSVTEHPRVIGDPQRIVADAAFDNAHKQDIAAAVLAMAAGRRTHAGPAPARRARAFLKVQDGCRHRCTYCSVWRARGASVSRPPEEVRRRLRDFVAEGYREIVLTGVDLGSYGRDCGTRLTVLLAALLDDLPERHRLRLSSINSNDIDPGLIGLAGHPKLCRQWHLPLQSGSDPILRAMHRGYRRAQFRNTVDALRAVAPDVEITTDVMAGFPGETDADHAATTALLEEVGVLDAHVFRWSARDGTPAADLTHRVPNQLARHRAADLARVARRSGARRLGARVGHPLEVVWVGDGLSAAPRGIGAGGQTVLRRGPVERGQLERVDITAVEDGMLVAAERQG